MQQLLALSALDCYRCMLRKRFVLPRRRQIGKNEKAGRPGVACSDAEAALNAIEHGALRYLTKPVDLDALVGVIEQAARLHAIARMKREAFQLLGSAGRLVGDRAGLEAALQRALSTLWMAFQPIVAWSERRIY